MSNKSVVAISSSVVVVASLISIGYQSTAGRYKAPTLGIASIQSSVADGAFNETVSSHDLTPAEAALLYIVENTEFEPRERLQAAQSLAEIERAKISLSAEIRIKAMRDIELEEHHQAMKAAMIERWRAEAAERSSR